MADTGSDDRVQKMEVDYSSTVDEKIPKCEKLAKVFTVIL
jgi:26S proteasome regulatory subunit N5